jgi:hypothetical protein
MVAVEMSSRASNARLMVDFEGGLEDNRDFLEDLVRDAREALSGFWGSESQEHTLVMAGLTRPSTFPL